MARSTASYSKTNAEAIYTALRIERSVILSKLAPVLTSIVNAAGVPARYRGGVESLIGTLFQNGDDIAESRGRIATDLQETALYLVQLEIIDLDTYALIRVYANKLGASGNF